MKEIVKFQQADDFERAIMIQAKQYLVNLA